MFDISSKARQMADEYNKYRNIIEYDHYPCVLLTKKEIDKENLRDDILRASRIFKNKNNPTSKYFKGSFYDFVRFYRSGSDCFFCKNQFILRYKAEEHIKTIVEKINKSPNKIFYKLLANIK